MIIPAILAKTKQEFESKIKKVMRFTNIVQIDVMDGVFVSNKTWGKTDVIKRLKLPIKFEAHLMVHEPEAVIESWADAGACRIIFHIEATSEPKKCIKEIKRFKREAGIAINPKTSLARIKDFLPSSRHSREGGNLIVNYILVMGVDPGFSGQKFNPSVLKKIKRLRGLAPNIKIAVDGGVNKKNAKEILRAGADILCTASAIFKSKNIARAIERLEK